MSEGEKMIWAAAYAKYYDIGEPPADVINDTQRWQEWEAQQTHAAIEYAGGAVERAREQLVSIGEGFGTDSSTYTMLAAMLTAPPATEPQGKSE